MAQGVRQLFRTDIGFATTGYAEPDKRNGIAEPCAWLAIVSDMGRDALFLERPGLSRNRVRKDAVRGAIQLAYEHLRRFE